MRFSPESSSEAYSLTPIITARRRVGAFSRHGKKEGIESLIRSIGQKASLQKRPSPRRAFDQPSGFFIDNPSINQIASLLRTFTLGATPFVTLKTRRRGKRPTIKVGHLSRVRGSRKALQALTASLTSRVSSGKPFATSLSRQLESLSAGNNKNRSAIGGLSNQSSGSIRERRDSLHAQALRSIPTS